MALGVLASGIWPAIRIFLGERELDPVAAPGAVAPRAWILGVVSVQASVEAGEARARLRAHITRAAAPRVWPLEDDQVVHVALTATPADPVGLPAVARPGSSPALAVFLDGVPVEVAELAPALVAADPPPRAFGHVFCRYLRDGGAETGFDLTEFASLPLGTKYRRIVSRELAVGAVVSYAWRQVRAATWLRE